MTSLIASLEKNKKSKGGDAEEVLDCISRLADPNMKFSDSSRAGEYSALAAVVELAPSEAQATQFARALLDRGAQAEDDHICGQRHNKAINQAIKKSYYDLAFTLIDLGAHANDVVHPWLGRPKNTRQAKGQHAMETLLWARYDAEQRQREIVPIMVSLIACEVLGGVETDRSTRDAITLAACQELKQRGLNNHQYLFSNLDDACKALRNPKRALGRLVKTTQEWFDAMAMDEFEDKNYTGRFSHIPREFWERLPSLHADKCAREIDHQMPRAAGRGRNPRL